MTSNKRNRIIIVCILLLFFFLKEYILPPQWYLKQVYSLEVYEGEIINKFRDRGNHNIQTLVLEDGTKVSFPRRSYYLFDSVKIGDYIHKEKGTLEALIIRDDSLIFTAPYFYYDSLGD